MEGRHTDIARYQVIKDDNKQELDEDNIKSILTSKLSRRAVDFSSLPPFPQSSARPPGKSYWVVSTIPSGDIPLRENTIPLGDIPLGDRFQRSTNNIPLGDDASLRLQSKSADSIDTNSVTRKPPAAVNRNQQRLEQHNNQDQNLAGKFLPDDISFVFGPPLTVGDDDRHIPKPWLLQNL